MSNDARIAVLETTILNINTTMLDIKQDMKHSFERLETKMDTKFDAIEKKMDTKFAAIENRLWSNFLWIMGMIIGLTGLIAHTQRWI